MPAKRKSKVPSKQAASTASAKTQPAGKRTSSLKGSRVAKSPVSRLKPSEPLHMSLRGAAKTAAPSVASGSNRSSSLGSITHFEDQNSDGENERPGKRSGASTNSGSPMGSYVSQLPAIETQDPKPTARTASNPSKVAGKKRRASGDSSESNRTVSAHPNGVLTRSESDQSEKQPRRKKRKTTETPPEPAEAPPELTDASTPSGSPEAILDVEGGQVLQHVLPSVNGEARAKAARRLPGRRRQPHPDINVETDLRRQLSLKMNYRSLAKLQKTLLDELANRTIYNLENDSEFHKQCPDYKHVVAALDQHRQDRINQIDAERRLKLEELERIRIAEERIQKEQYINRFQEFQDNYVLQCMHALMQLEREMKAESGNATDDEEHVVEPTHMEFLAINHGDDRLGSKFASRSRAYIETERMLDEKERRDTFEQELKAFLAQNEDLDDPIEGSPGGFAQFVGPDRSEAIAHHHISALVAAATELERTPTEPELPKVIANEQADALFLLASLSAERPQEDVTQQQPQPVQDTVPTSPPSQIGTPASPTALLGPTSPFEPQSNASAAMSLETPTTSPAKPSGVHDNFGYTTPKQDATGVTVEQESEVVKKATPVRTSHRIMDILNDDEDVSVSKMRGSLPPVFEPYPSASPARQENIPQSQPLRYNSSGDNAIVQDDDPYPAAEDELYPRTEENSYGRISEESYREAGEAARSRSPPQSGQYWYSNNPGLRIGQASEDNRTPLKRIKEMLEHQRARNTTETHRRRSEVENGHRERQEPYSVVRESVDRTQMGPPLSRPFSPHEKSSTGREVHQNSTRAVSASPSNAPLSYEHSPIYRHSTPYAPPLRQSSHDQVHRPQWDGERRQSGSQASAPLPPYGYVTSPAQPYIPDLDRTRPTSSGHQKTYAPPSAGLPAPVNTLPPKPPAPPPINYRFAHYDPVPAKVAYHQQSPYLGVPHPPLPGPPPSPYGMPYIGHPSYQGYVPPPGSFQAPPPPILANSPYPPLKIHQYGGQPILPASMAPPPHASAPMQPYAQPPLAPSPFSPQGPPPPGMARHLEPAPIPPPPTRLEERSDSQSRPRRAYRSYHAPGTEFRSYQPHAKSRRG